LRLHASTTIGNYLVPRLLAGFRRECPLGRVEAHIGNTLEVIRAVQDFSAELGLIEGPCQESGLVVSPWILDELVLVAAPAHPLARAAKHRPLTIAQLAEGPWLLREEGSGTREAVDLAVLPHIHSFGEARILGGSEAIKNAAAFGLGVSCLSRWVVEDLVRARRLVILDTRLPVLRRRLSIIWHREKTLSAGLGRFIAHCRALEPDSPPDAQRI
jgi:DNA-binding transcriptional LysR family regulator